MLKLVVGSTEVQSASLPIRWCVGQPLLSKIAAEEIPKPQLLLIVEYPHSQVVKGKEDRYLIPLNQMVQYVTFRRLGEYRILALIVWNHRGNVTELRNRYLVWERGQYQTTVIGYDGKLLKNFQTMPFAELAVVVPQELFAKEPPEWEQWWAPYHFGRLK